MEFEVLVSKSMKGLQIFCVVLAFYNQLLTVICGCSRKILLNKYISVYVDGFDLAMSDTE